MTAQRKTTALTIALLIATSTFVGLLTVPGTAAAGPVGNVIDDLTDDSGTEASADGKTDVGLAADGRTATASTPSMSRADVAREAATRDPPMP